MEVVMIPRYQPSSMAAKSDGAYVAYSDYERLAARQQRIIEMAISSFGKIETGELTAEDAEKVLLVFTTLAP